MNTPTPRPNSVTPSNSSDQDAAVSIVSFADASSFPLQLSLAPAPTHTPGSALQLPTLNFVSASVHSPAPVLVTIACIPIEKRAIITDTVAEVFNIHTLRDW